MYKVHPNPTVTSFQQKRQSMSWNSSVGGERSGSSSVVYTLYEEKKNAMGDKEEWVLLKQNLRGVRGTSKGLL